jgi:hypothetical protein
MALYDLAGDRRKQNLDLLTNMSELAFKTWQQQQENDPTVIAAKAKAQMQGMLQAYKALQGEIPTTDTSTDTGIPDYLGGSLMGSMGNGIGGNIGTGSPFFLGGSLKNPSMKINPFVQANLNIAESGAKTKINEIAKGQMAWGQTDKMIDNMISATKSAYIQAGGGGLVEGTLGNIATGLRLPNTGNIQGLKTTARDTAAAYAKVLTGGSRGVLGMFNRILDTIPKDATMTSEQAGSSLAEMYLTGAAIEKGLKSGALDPEKLKKMTTAEVESWVSSNSLSAEEQTQLYKNLSTKFQAIAPRKQINLMTGEVKEPEMNSWNKAYDNLKKGFAKKTFSEEDIQHTMKTHKMTREQVMKELSK